MLEAGDDVWMLCSACRKPIPFGGTHWVCSVSTCNRAPHVGGPALSNHYEHDDVLVVVSKVKKYIRDRSGMNTSDAVAEALSAHLRKVSDDAIRNAAGEGRKTVLERDVPPAFPR